MSLPPRDAARILRSQMTPAEARLWSALRNHRLLHLHFRRQRPIGRFIADFYCHRALLVVEVDGSIHREPGQVEYDRDRDEICAALGIRVLRVTNEDVFNDLDTVIGRIREVCQIRLAEPK